MSMTNQQGAPEALRLADIADDEAWAFVIGVRKEIAAELRRLHAENERLAALVEAQQPAPSAAAAVVVYEQKENEMQVWFRPARMHGHPERTPIKATITKDRGNGIVDLTYDDGEFSGNARAVPNALRLPRNVREQVAVWWDVGFEMDFQTAVDNSLKKKKDDPPPQPSPTPQADSAPATGDLITIRKPTTRAEVEWLVKLAHLLVGDVNEQLQRVLDGAEAPQADSQPAPDEIINMAREQGLPETEIEGVFRVNVDDLGRMFAADRAASAPADSATAPAGGLGWKLVPMEITDAMRNAAAQAGMEALDLRDAGASNVGLVPKMYEAMLAAAPTPPAQAADSVLEDAARLDFLCSTDKVLMIECEQKGLWRVYQDEAPPEAAQHHWQAIASEWHTTPRAAIDAARKQGANHD